jgi:ferritin-like metal-binding protein YciE
MALSNLHDLYVDELKDLYNAESQLLKALPKMAKAASAPELKRAFEDHLEVTQGHVQRLETIFEDLSIPARGKKCKAMEGLIAEGAELIAEKGEPSVKDAGLIAAAQRVEHYEMAGYGCVRTFAKLLGYEDAVALLQQTLDEEGEADKALTELAESIININAEGADDEEEEGDESGEDEEEAEDAEEEEEKKPARGSRQAASRTNQTATQAKKAPARRMTR